MAGTPFSQAAGNYTLSSDLARLCLPTEYQDTTRVLAWVNSICFLFMLIGLVGLKAPRIVERPLTPLTEVVPVIFTPPEEQPKPQPEVKQDEPEPQDKPLDTPQVAVVVAAADASQVAFAVPVQGAVAISSARFATPPPPLNIAPPKPTRFDPNASQGGTYPPPSYPSIAIRNRYQGTATIEIMVDASGVIVSAKLVKSSGYPILDEAALQVVKTRWHPPPGAAHDWLWDCTFELK